MREHVATFGPGGILVGILTEPEESIGEAVVVMSNIGLNHRVGPSRTWVELARRLAQRGVASLRFDVSGLGDSDPRVGLLSDIDRSVLDLTDALDWLGTRFPPRFILAALCSGCDNAHRLAVCDPRVVGAVFLDGYTYITPGYWVRRRILRWVSTQHWLRGLRRRFPHAFGIEGEPATEQIYNREYPTRAQFEADLTQMVDRGTKVLYVYSGETMYAYKDQFWDWLRRKTWNDCVSVEHYPKADHTYTFGAERQVMLDRVERWITGVAGERLAPETSSLYRIGPPPSSPVGNGVARSVALR